MYRLSGSSLTPSAMQAIDMTSNFPTGVAIATSAVDRVHVDTVYAGTNRGIYRGHSFNGGANWSWSAYMNGFPPADVRNLEVHPVTGVLRASTFGRGAYEVHTEHPIGSLLVIQGRPTFLRVHDVGTKYGPPSDQLDAEVIFKLDANPRRAFGFQLRTDGNGDARAGMLDVLRDAFAHNRVIRVDYVRTGLHNGQAIRIVGIP
jgi:hypothetical protein